jgi:homogentisate 1,2-dioxygenase
MTTAQAPDKTTGMTPSHNSNNETTTTTETTKQKNHVDDDDDDDDDDDSLSLTYLSGFGNELSSEVIPGAIPLHRNTPRMTPYRLYTEQLSGTAFTAPRARNRRTWLYRIQPLVLTTTHSPSGTTTTTASDTTTIANDAPTTNTQSGTTITTATTLKTITTTTTTTIASTTTTSPWFLGKCDPATCQAAVDPIRWNPLQGGDGRTTTSSSTKQVDTTVGSAPKVSSGSSNTTVDFLDGFYLLACAGEPRNRVKIYQYRFPTTKSTTSRCLYNTDGDWLMVPHRGTLLVTTELGRMHVSPREIAMIPRNIVFQLTSSTTVTNDDDDESPEMAMCAGYVLEVDSPTGLELPERGPIGANGLANPRDFLHPTAWCVDQANYNNMEFEIWTKHEEQLYQRIIPHSPFNVVGWHGNYLPYKYHLNHFCAVNSVTYDHLDPSVYTVLTCPSAIHGTALADVVVFPPRMVATDSNTLRPPWFHRNVMSEFMGLIDGSYDAKQGSGFQPGGASLHNLGTPHGPDAATYHNAVDDPCDTPIRLDKGMAFMFETYLPLKINPNLHHYQTDYVHCWQGLTDQFTGWDQIPPNNETKR